MNQAQKKSLSAVRTQSSGKRPCPRASFQPVGDRDRQHPAGRIIVGVYARAVHAPFIFDDEDVVLNNPSIVRLWPLIGEPVRPGR